VQERSGIDRENYLIFILVKPGITVGRLKNIMAASSWI